MNFSREKVGINALARFLQTTDLLSPKTNTNSLAELENGHRNSIKHVE